MFSKYLHPSVAVQEAHTDPSNVLGKLLRGHKAGQISPHLRSSLPSGMWLHVDIPSRTAASVICENLQCCSKVLLRPRVISSALDEGVAAVEEHMGVQCCAGAESTGKPLSCAAEHVALTPD